MKRLLAFALRLYPASWRTRYGAELEALVEDMQPGVLGWLDLLRGALTMRVVSWRIPVHVAMGTLAGAALAAAIVVAAPKHYASTSTIEVLGNLDGRWLLSTAKSAFSDDNMRRVMRENGLYAPGRSESSDEALNRFRQDVSVHIDSLSPREVYDQPAGTMQVSFTYDDAKKADRVTGELVTLMIDQALETAIQQRKAATPLLQLAGQGQLRVGRLTRDVSTPRAVPIVAGGLFGGALLGLAYSVIVRRRSASR